MRDLVESLDAVSESKGIHIHIQPDLSEQPRWLYPSMTQMVLSNILRNALNYSQGSQIDIIQQKKQPNYCR